MAATAVPIASDEAGESAQAGSEDVVLYFGIIDILQVSCRMAWARFVAQVSNAQYVCDYALCARCEPFTA